VVRPGFKPEGAVIDDFQGDLAPEPGVDGRSRDVGCQSQPSLLALAFHAGRQFALQRQRDVLQRADENELPGWNDHHAVRAGRQWVEKIAQVHQLDAIQVDVVPASRRRQRRLPHPEVIADAQVQGRRTVLIWLGQWING
jgi:hypothetical protein